MRLLLPFDTDDPEFTRGVELGMFWQQLGSLPPGVERFDAQIHTSNLEMVVRAVEAIPGWAVRVEAVTDEDANTYDDWTLVVLTRADTEESTDGE